MLPLHLKRRRSPQERREELQGRATIPRVPQMSPSIAGKPVFPSLPRLSSRASTHTTVTRGRALWESLLGKPRGKASRESHRSLDPREGKLNTAAAARRKVHLHAPLITRTDYGICHNSELFCGRKLCTDLERQKDVYKENTTYRDLLVQ